MIRTLAGVLLILSLPSVLSAQQKEKDQYVVIPSEMVLLTTTSPPGCPIQFENARLLMNMQGEYAFSYDVRNVSAKPIAHWGPMFWTSSGTGGTLISEDERKEGYFLLPGEVFREKPPRLVPLTEELRKRLNLNLDKAPREMVVLVINGVVFQDGSRYENASFVAAVRSYLEKLADDLNQLEGITKEYKKLKPR